MICLASTIIRTSSLRVFCIKENSQDDTEVNKIHGFLYKINGPVGYVKLPQSKHDLEVIEEMCIKDIYKEILMQIAR